MGLVKEKFGIKVFLAFTLVVLFISITLTIYYARHQYRLLFDTLITDGRLLAGLLAHNVRIGVFSENDLLLQDSVDGIFKQDGIRSVSIFNAEGRLLKRRQHPMNDGPAGGSLTGRALIALHIDRSLDVQEKPDAIDFWARVQTESSFSPDGGLLFKETPNRKANPVIGLVQITMDKKQLQLRLNDLIAKSVLMGAVFLLIGSGATYFLVKGITRPLNRLTQSVEALGSGDDVAKVPVETHDEIGNLAEAFNRMSDSLKGREKELIRSENRLRFLSSRLFKAQEHERHRLSKGLHDEMGQSLAMLKHRVRAIPKKMQAGPSELQAACDHTIAYIDQIIEEVRRLSRDLSPSIIEDLGLTAALRWMIGNFDRRYAIRSHVDFGDFDIDRLFSAELQTNLYRIFQEVLTNIVKHAEARHVTFAVKKNRHSILLQVKDDGKGFDVEQAMTKNFTERGMGLDAMNERAHMLGATLDISSRIDRGTRISLDVPYSITPTGQEDPV